MNQSYCNLSRILKESKANPLLAIKKMWKASHRRWSKKPGVSKRRIPNL